MRPKETSLVTAAVINPRVADLLKTPKPVNRRRASLMKAAAEPPLGSPQFEISERFWQRFEQPRATPRIHRSISLASPRTAQTPRAERQVSLPPIVTRAVPVVRDPVSLLSEIAQRSEMHRQSVAVTQQRLQSLLIELDEPTTELPAEPTLLAVPQLESPSPPPPQRSPEPIQSQHASPVSGVRQISKQSTPRQQDPIDQLRQSRELDERATLRRRVEKSPTPRTRVVVEPSSRAATSLVVPPSAYSETEIDFSAVLDTISTHKLQLESLRPLLEKHQPKRVAERPRQPSSSIAMSQYRLRPIKDPMRKSLAKSLHT